MSIRFEDTGDPADEEALEELEERAGHPLPVSYRDFLEAHDGAVPEANHLPDAATGAEVAVWAAFTREAEDLDELLDRLEPVAEAETDADPDLLDTGYSAAEFEPEA